VRKITAAYAVAAVLIGFVYAPLFHVHGGGTYQTDTPLLHAHFPERVIIPPFTAFSSQDSHGAAHSIDFITAASAHVVQIDAVVSDVILEFNAGHIAFGFGRSDDVERTHAPPALEAHSPRAPPV
jgi:hypothetical protein